VDGSDDKARDSGSKPGDGEHDGDAAINLRQSATQHDGPSVRPELPPEAGAACGSTSARWRGQATLSRSWVWATRGRRASDAAETKMERCHTFSTIAATAPYACSNVTGTPARTVLCTSATASVTRKSSAILSGAAEDDTLAR